MAQRGQRSDRMAAVFVLGVVLFTPPLLNVFDAGAETTVFGVPLLYLYLFLAWAVLIVLMGVTVGKPAPDGAGPGTDADADARRGAGDG